MTRPEPPTLHNTFAIERSYPHPVSRVFAALSDPAKKRRWYAQGRHHDVEDFQLDFREGGREYLRSRFKEGTPFPGVHLIHEGSILDIAAQKRIVIASTMTVGGRRISISLVTFELFPDQDGTRLVLTHQGLFFDRSDGPQMREAGWRELADRLSDELSRQP